MTTSDQAANAESPSMADRIADAFLGKEPDEQPPPQEADASEGPAVDEASDPDTAASEDAAPDAPASTEDGWEEVDWNGAKYKVPAELKEPLIHASDYTKKTQEVAEQRRLVEYQAQALKLAESERKFTDSVRDEVMSLAQIDSQLKQYKALDWASLSTDEAFRYKLQQDQLKEQRDAAQAELGRKHQQWQEETKKAHADLVQKGLETIRKSIPNFSEATAKEITESATRDGYTAEEVAAILDPRYVRTLWKAAQYDKLQAAKTPTAQKLAQAKPIAKVTPTSRPMDDAARQRIAFAKAKSSAKTSADKARVIQKFLESQF